MNFIQQLQKENAELKAILDAAAEKATAMMAYIESPKFTGEEDGERKDWIGTSELHNWLMELRSDVSR